MQLFMEINYCPKCGNQLRTADISRQTRIRCSSSDCDYVFWNNPTPVVAAIIEVDNNMIILARNKGWPEKVYGLITGFLEHGETPGDAVLREVREELNLYGTFASFIGNYTFFEMNQLIIAYHVIARGEPIIGDELADIKLVPVENLKPWATGTGPAVRDWLAARGFSRR